MSQTHKWPVRIYYEDTDTGGIVYYANYLKFAERARTEMLRELGIESQRIKDDLGIGLAVRRCHAEYMKPAKLDDQLVVETKVLKMGGVSMELHQTIIRDDETLVQMEVKLGSINFESGRPEAFPREMRSALESRLNPGSGKSQKG